LKYLNMKTGTGNNAEHKFVFQETMASIYEFEKIIKFNFEKIT